jgi:hypothetical protein
MLRAFYKEGTSRALRPGSKADTKQALAQRRSAKPERKPQAGNTPGVVTQVVCNGQRHVQWGEQCRL